MEKFNIVKVDNKIYNRYHNRIKKEYNQTINFLYDIQMEKWGRYLMERIPNEERFPLFYYLIMSMSRGNAKKKMVPVVIVKGSTFSLVNYI